jgi:TetR/AcrR family acrAB operon transcriptional repressor
MLFVPEVLDFGRHARQMVESMIDALRSPALRMGA